MGSGKKQRHRVPRTQPCLLYRSKTEEDVKTAMNTSPSTHRRCRGQSREWGPGRNKDTGLHARSHASSIGPRAIWRTYGLKTDVIKCTPLHAQRTNPGRRLIPVYLGVLLGLLAVALVCGLGLVGSGLLVCRCSVVGLLSLFVVALPLIRPGSVRCPEPSPSCHFHFGHLLGCAGLMPTSRVAVDLINLTDFSCLVGEPADAGFETYC